MAGGVGGAGEDGTGEEGAGEGGTGERAGAWGGEALWYSTGTTMLISSCALEGLGDKVGRWSLLLDGVERGDGPALAEGTLDGVGTLPSLAVATWPGLVLGAVLLGDAAKVFGVIALVLWASLGLDRSMEG